MNEPIENMIYLVRGHRVMLDADLAILYGVETRSLNQALRRNADRFPEDFAFQLTSEECDFLRSQTVISNDTANFNLKSQFATSKEGRGGRRYLPYVFTEHGVVMLANVLRSKHAIEMSIKVVRAFISLKNALVINEKLAKELQEVKSFMLKNAHQNSREFQKVWKAIEKLSTPPPQEQRRIGFDLSQH